MGRDDRRAGVADAHQRRCLSPRDPFRRDPDRRPRLAPQRQRRRFGNPDHVARLDHPDVERRAIRMTRELGVDQVRTTDEVDADPQVPRRRQCPVDHAPRRMIAAHGVDGDAHC